MRLKGYKVGNGKIFSLMKYLNNNGILNINKAIGLTKCIIIINRVCWKIGVWGLGQVKYK